MGRIVRGAVVAAVLVTLVAMSPARVEADGPQTVPYTCDKTGGSNFAPASLSADVPVSATDSADPAKVFQQTVWRFQLTIPALESGFVVDFHYVRMHIPIPDGVHVIAANAVAPAGQTPNPPLSHVSVAVVGGEILVQVPKPSLQNAAHRIRLTAGGQLRYPSPSGPPVVLPDLRIIGVPTPDAADTTIEWAAPVVDGKAEAFGFATATYRCDADSPTTLVSTVVSPQRQLCDGRAVTVQLGFSAPTTGNDVIQGTPAADVANGRAGNDRFCGSTGADVFHGGGGNDRALGGPGDDQLWGDAGADRLQGDAGADTLNGGANRDTLIGGRQRDTCNGGRHADTARGCEVRVSIP